MAHFEKTVDSLDPSRLSDNKIDTTGFRIRFINEERAIKRKKSRMQSADKTPEYLPEYKDFEKAYNILSSSGEAISIDRILHEIENDIKNTGRQLKINWHYITERNISEGWLRQKLIDDDKTEPTGQEVEKSPVKSVITAEKNERLLNEKEDLLKINLTDKNSKSTTYKEDTERYSQEAKKAGDYAEEKVLEDLIKKYGFKRHNRVNLKEKKEPGTIRWVAADGEKPGWDIEYVDHEGIFFAIEVKGTKEECFVSFELTANEWEAAIREGNNYKLILVTNCTPEKKSSKQTINNPAELVKEGKLKVTPIQYRVALVN